MTNTKLVTRESLQHMLNTSDVNKQQHIIGRALVVLLNKQTSSEQANNATLEHNNVGFSGVDGKSGAITAKYYLKHKSLLPWQINKWLKLGKSGYSRITKYHAQLNASAVAKANQK